MCWWSWGVGGGGAVDCEREGTESAGSGTAGTARPRARRNRSAAARSVPGVGSPDFVPRPLRFSSSTFSLWWRRLRAFAFPVTRRACVTASSPARRKADAALSNSSDGTACPRLSVEDLDRAHGLRASGGDPVAQLRGGVLAADVDPDPALGHAVPVDLEVGPVLLDLVVADHGLARVRQGRVEPAVVVGIAVRFPLELVLLLLRVRGRVVVHHELLGDEEVVALPGLLRVDDDLALGDPVVGLHPVLGRDELEVVLRERPAGLGRAGGVAEHEDPGDDERGHDDHGAGDDPPELPAAGLLLRRRAGTVAGRASRAARRVLAGGRGPRRPGPRLSVGWCRRR